VCRVQAHTPCPSRGSSTRAALAEREESDTAAEAPDPRCEQTDGERARYKLTGRARARAPQLMLRAEPSSRGVSAVLRYPASLRIQLTDREKAACAGHRDVQRCYQPRTGSRVPRLKAHTPGREA